MMSEKEIPSKCRCEIGEGRKADDDYADVGEPGFEGFDTMTTSLLK